MLCSSVASRWASPSSGRSRASSPSWPAAGGGHLLGQGPAQGAQGGGERGERQSVGPDLDAGPDGDDGVAPFGRRDELLDQAGLADACLAADQQCLRVAGRGARERLGERGELLCAPDEHGAD